jgi:hypothetical protein
MGERRQGWGEGKGEGKAKGERWERQRGERGKAEGREGNGRKERWEIQKGERGKTEGREGERKMGERAKERGREDDTISPFKVLIFVLSHCIGSILSSDFLIFNLDLFYWFNRFVVSVYFTSDTPYLLALCGLKYLLACISRSFEFRCIAVSTSKSFLLKSSILC